MRNVQYDVMREIQERWSPRAFSGKAVPREELLAIIGAASLAPSCFNEQPWRFFIADSPERLEPFHRALLAKNALWASKAPVLIFVLAEKTFKQNGKDNAYHAFDSGTAWGFLSLEAKRRGIITHAMAGFKKEALRVDLGLPETLLPITLIALGYAGDPADLDESLKDDEHPRNRMELHEIILNHSDFEVKK